MGEKETTSSTGEEETRWVEQDSLREGEGVYEQVSWWEVLYSLIDTLKCLPEVIVADGDYYKLMIFVCSADPYLYRWWYYGETVDGVEVLCQVENEDLYALIEWIRDLTAEFENELPQQFERHRE